MFARRERGSFWIPLVVVTLMTGVLFYLNSGALQPIFDAEFDRGIAVAVRDNPKIPPEAIERMRGFLDPDTVSPLLLAVVGRMDVFTIWISVLIAIGVSVAGRIPLGRAAIAAAIETED